MLSVIELYLSQKQTCTNQKHRANVSAEDTETNHQKTVFIPLLDGVLLQIKSRFSNHNQKAEINTQSVLCLLQACPSTIPPRKLSGRVSSLVWYGVREGEKLARRCDQCSWSMRSGLLPDHSHIVEDTSRSVSLHSIN